MIDQIKSAITAYREENGSINGKRTNFKSIKAILPENQVKMIESIILFENNANFSTFLNQFESLAQYDFLKDFSSNKYDDCKYFICEISKNEFFVVRLTFFDKAEPIETMFQYCSSKNGVTKSEIIRITCDDEIFNVQHEKDYSGRTRFESEVYTYEFENNNPLIISKKTIIDPEAPNGERVIYDKNGLSK